MSKISLEPNDSGAGTFSIVSPDSNTNRTLTLPDEAGKLLSTGNDNPAEVFKQSNILGTVSESGGAPTGAIIERGSNANGEFVKYADGTMISTVRKLFSDIDLSSDDNSRLVNRLPFPVEFVSPPYTNAIFNSTNSSTNASAAIVISRIGTANSTINMDYDVWSLNTSGTFDLSFDFIFTGRWY